MIKEDGLQERLKRNQELIHLSQTLKIALQNYKKKQDYYKKIFGRRYIKYRLEDVVNSFGKVVELRIVREELSNKNSERIDLIFTKLQGES